MDLPLQEIPGSYGLPLVGPVTDRLEFNGPGGQDAYVKKRVEAYKSTVFRAHMPPGPPGFPDSRAIFVADQNSFQVLFDIEQIEKKNVLIGSYMPSTEYTGGFRVLAYLDPIEDEGKHFKLKKFCFKIVSINAPKWLPYFEDSMKEVFSGWEKEKDMQSDGNDSFSTGFAFDCLTRVVLNNARMRDGAATAKRWIGPQVAPLGSALIFAPLPFIVVQREYNKLTEFFRSNGGEVLDMAENELGIDREEALHNLIFLVCFNAFGGMDILLPSLLKYIGDAGEDLHHKLREEIRAAVKQTGGKLTMEALQNAPLLNSTVYEVLRIDPPIKNQCGRARRDIIIASHTASFKVSKGEFIVGYQPFATKDPVVFATPQDFVPHRFMGAQGERLLQYVLWSNGPETQSPSTDNKQCGGKQLPLLFGRLFIAHMFLRYDSFAVEAYVLGPLIKFTKLVKAVGISKSTPTYSSSL